MWTAPVQQIGQLHRAAGVNQQNDGQTQTVQGAQVVPLPVAEVVIPFFQPAVLALPRDAAQDIDRRRGSLHVLEHDGPALGQDEGVGRIGVKGVFHPAGRLQHLLLPGGAGPHGSGLRNPPASSRWSGGAPRPLGPGRWRRLARLLTSPEPIPPLTVRLAPLPNSATGAERSSGRVPVFFSRTMPPAAARRARRPCSSSRGEGSRVRVPL